VRRDREPLLVVEAVHTVGGVQVFLVDCAALADVLEDFERAQSRLSDDEVRRFERLATVRGSDDARLWRAAHVALRVTLEYACGPVVRGLAYDTAAGGRPFLACAGAPSFSLAHSGGLALIGIARTPIGVDIEVSRAVDVSAERRQRIERTAARLAPECPLPEESDAQFLQAWVRLEACAKASGLGIGRLLTESGIVGGSARGTDVPGATLTQHVRDLDIGKGRFAAVATRHLPEQLVVEAFPTTVSDIEAFLGKGQ
jgi:4'-phosphopantetheinyl transferase